MRALQIAPSILSADFCRLAHDIAAVEAAGARLLHLDVMDGHFVPNLSIGVPVVEAVNRCTDLFLDTHLMIDNPEKYVKPFADAGADGITFHIEVAKDPHALIRQIRDQGARVGVALNPGTPVESVLEVLPLVDLVLVMTVWPGFGGQQYIHDCTRKIEVLAPHMTDAQWLEVDGGINPKTVPLAVAAGADTLVAGSAIFGAGDAAGALNELTRLAEGARPVVERRT